MKKKKQSEMERFLALTDAERDAEVARFDKPLPLGPDGLPGKPLTPAQRKLWRAIKHNMGRPTVGEGAEQISLTVERGLLKKADAFAKKHKLKRSQMVAEALRLLMQRRDG
jgi:hypothetical protein